MSNRIPEDAEQKQRRAAAHRRRYSADERERMAAHRGMATWGERLVPLDVFHDAVHRYGRALGADEAAAERAAFVGAAPDATPVEGPYSKIAVFGGIYNNSHALEALLDEAARHGAEAIYCLGDFGGFGPLPERVWPLLVQGGVRSIQGNYEQSLASGAEDCNCGYADPRDNHFAALSYRYTAENTSAEFKRWMGGHPLRRRVRVGERELLLVHGSPRQINEFLFASATSVPYLEVLLDQERADGLLCTHTGLHWHRRLPSGRDVVNVGVIGRPANDGRTEVWWSLLEERDGELAVELRPLAYDHQGLARDMAREHLPQEFIDTILTGWWTTCLEILPAKERSRSRF
ncbi:MAG: metallophosphoesterase family protein [Acidobacteriota bacterium]